MFLITKLLLDWWAIVISLHFVFTKLSIKTKIEIKYSNVIDFELKELFSLQFSNSS